MWPSTSEKNIPPPPDFSLLVSLSFSTNKVCKNGGFFQHILCKLNAFIETSLSFSSHCKTSTDQICTVKFISARTHALYALGTDYDQHIFARYPFYPQLACLPHRFRKDRWKLDWIMHIACIPQLVSQRPAIHFTESECFTENVVFLHKYS